MLAQSTLAAHAQGADDPPRPIPSLLIWVRGVGSMQEPSPRGPSGTCNSLCLMTAENHYSSLSCKQLSAALIRATEELRAHSSWSEGVCTPNECGLCLLTGNAASCWPAFQERGAGWGLASCLALSGQGSPLQVVLYSLGQNPSCPRDTTSQDFHTPSWPDIPPGGQPAGQTPLGRGAPDTLEILAVPSFFGGGIPIIVGEEVCLWGLNFKQVETVGGARSRCAVSSKSELSNCL